jgi:hypothetical protein
MSWMSRGARQGGDRRGSRPPALADLEWQGQGCKVTLEHIRDVMPAFRGEQGDRKKDPPSGRLWTALHEIDRYLT